MLHQGGKAHLMLIGKNINMLVKSVKPSVWADPDEELSGQFIDPRSSHCPRENQRKRQKAKSKPKQQSSQPDNTIPSAQENLNNLTSLPNTTRHTSTPNAQYGGLSFTPFYELKEAKE